MLTLAGTGGALATPACSTYYWSIVCSGSPSNVDLTLDNWPYTVFFNADVSNTGYSLNGGVGVEINVKNGNGDRDLKFLMSSGSSIFAKKNDALVITNNDKDGDVYAKLDGSITSKKGDGVVIKTTKGGDVKVDSFASIDANDDGIHIETKDYREYSHGHWTTYTGDVNLSVFKKIEAGEDGVDVTTQDGDVNIRTVNWGHHSGGVIDADGDGIKVRTDDGDVNVNVGANIYAGDVQHGHGNPGNYPNNNHQQSNGVDIKTDDGNVNVTTGSSGGHGYGYGNSYGHGSPDGTIKAEGDGIKVQTDDGDVHVHVGANIEAGDVHDGHGHGNPGNYPNNDHQDSNGVDIKTDSGDVSVSTGSSGHGYGFGYGYGHSSGGTIKAEDDGIKIQTDEGDVHVKVGADIDAGEDGVHVETKSGDISIATGTGHGGFGRHGNKGEIDAHDDGIQASSISGDINVYVGEDVTGAESALDLSTKYGKTNVVIGRHATVSGEGSNHDPVISIDSGSKAKLVNLGVIESDADKRHKTDAERSNDLAIDIDGKHGSDIYNGGLIIGRVDLTKGNDWVTNNGVWLMTGVSDFGDAHHYGYGYHHGDFDVFHNEDALYTALDGDEGEFTYLKNLELFVNGSYWSWDCSLPAVVSMVDGGTGDVTKIDGAWKGVGDNDIAVDYNFGTSDGDQVIEEPSGDKIVIGRIANGHEGTTVVINDVGGNGLYDPIGTTLVKVLRGSSTEADDFTLYGGPIEKGLFTYSLAYFAPYSQYNDSHSGEWRMVSAPNEQADNLPGVTSAVQSYWQGATEGWEDRVLQLHGGNGGPLGYADEDKPAPNDAAWVASGAVPPPKNDAGNGHVWVRVVGRESESDITSTIGNTTYDGGFDESLLAVEGGIDGAVQLNGSTMFLGLMGGYADSSIDFDDTTTKAKIDGPMLGAYLSWVKNNFYLDVLTKADFLNVDYTAEAGSDSMDGLSLGVRADVGYRVDLARNWFIVPSAMLAYVNTSVDDMNIADTDIRFQDGESLRAKAGFRLGNTFRSAGGTVFEPYVSLAVGNEFLGDNKAFIDSNGYTLTAASDVSGLYGEVGAGYKVAFGGSHVTGFGRGYYRFADGYESVTGQLGLSYGW